MTKREKEVTERIGATVTPETKEKLRRMAKMFAVSQAQILTNLINKEFETWMDVKPVQDLYREKYNQPTLKE